MIPLLVAAASLAQQPSEAWRTVRTEHYRVHYPVEAAQWAEAAAGRIEEIRRRVTDEVGYDPPRVVDILVRDPYSVANGQALPFLGSPRIELWASPPSADSVIGDLRSWDELLLVHEYTHLAHLLRPSRNPIGRLTGAFLGFGPVVRKSPFWVIEGYATVVEGRLTGSGRPNGSFRGALLAALAREGRLPSYAELDWSDRYGAGTFRYLVGSAFLEWLEEEVAPTVGASEHPLRDLWARMTSRHVRSFDEAFRGVFRDAPEVLYDRFREVVSTAAGMQQEFGSARRDTLFLDNPWGTSSPTVSADGQRLAAIVDSDRGPTSLVVWQTAPDEEAERKWREHVAKVVARDPQDVAPVFPEAFPPKEVARRSSWLAAPESAAFLPDGSLVYAAWTSDGSGRFRPDLFAWDPGTGKKRRITRHADVRSPAPSPDGSWIAAVRQDWGRTEIVKVDPATGAVTPWIAPGVDGLVDQPTPGPAGAVAWLEHRDSAWYPVIRRGEVEERPDLPGVIDLAWSPAGELYGVRGERSRLEIWRIDGTPGRVAPGTDPVTGLAAGPDALWVTVLDAQGVDVRRLATSALGDPVAPPSEAPVAGPALPAPVPVEAERYGFGHTDWRVLLGGAFSSTENNTEVALRLGDMVGRWEVLARGGYGDPGGVDGGGLALTWRGLPVEILASGWYADGAVGPDWTPGGYGAFRWERRFQDGGFGIELGGVGDGIGLGVGAGEIAVGWIEPRTAALIVQSDARAEAGTSTLADLSLEVALGRAWGLDLNGSAGIASENRPFSLGGVDTTLVASAARWTSLVEPAFAPGAASGTEHLSADAELLTPWLGIFGAHHQLGTVGATAAGVRLDSAFPRQPLAKLPSFDVSFGAGIRLQDPATGWITRPSFADLAAWGSVFWRL